MLPHSLCSDKGTTFEVFACCTCGVLFALTSDHGGILRTSHVDFCCPNGHKNCFRKPEPIDDPVKLKEQIANLRTEIMQVRHEAEQAEARASEAEAKAGCSRMDKALERAAAEDKAEEAAKGEVKERKEYAPFRCDQCGKTYRYPGAFKNHLRLHRKAETATNVAEGQKGGEQHV